MTKAEKTGGRGCALPSGLLKIVLACVIFSGFASTPPAITDISLAPATIVWNYIGELVFNMLVLVGCIKMSDRLVHELMGI